MRIVDGCDIVLIEDDPARAEKIRGAWSAFWQVVVLGAWLSICWGVGAHTPGATAWAWLAGLALTARAAWRITHTPGWAWGVGLLVAHWAILFVGVLVVCAARG